MDILRSFLAADISDPVRKEAAGLILRLETGDADVKWITPQNLHFTLKFLGHLTHQQVLGVKDFIFEVGSRREPFSIHLSGVGAFPSLDRPSVIWIGVDEGAAEMADLAGELARKASLIGLHDEEARPFSAHLTLGRVRSVRRLASFAGQLKESAFSSTHKVVVDHITLYKSTLTPAGSVYEPLAVTSFKDISRK